MPLPIFVVGAFVVNGEPFTGNAAAVCLLEYDDDITDEVKQQIAMEMNLSETAFVSLGWTKGNKLLTASGSDIERRTLRWFTPTNEVPLCGHATVASAKVLWETEMMGQSTPKTISFESKFRGKLGATIEKDNTISLNFPSNPTHALSENPKENPWLDAMLVNAVGSKRIVQEVQYSPGAKILFIRLKDELGPVWLQQVKPNFQQMLEIETGDFVHDIIVTVKGEGGSDGYHFYSRFFAPWDGINEDPVTGLAHTVLTPYWAKQLEIDGEMRAKQHSVRGGQLRCTLLGDRVKITGSATISLKGELMI